MTLGSFVLATPKEVSKLTANLTLGQVGQGNLSLDVPLLLPFPVQHEKAEHSASVVLHSGVEPTG